MWKQPCFASHRKRSPILNATRAVRLPKSIFRRKPGELLLEIADHGCGISKEILKQLNRGTALPGIGIAGMRERIRLLGGLMEICSSSDGTTVRVKLPIKSTRLDRQPA